MAKMGFSLFCLLAVAGAKVCVASNDLNIQEIQAAIQEGDVVTQSVVKDDKGGEIKVLKIIRDISWPATITFDPNSYYELVPEQYFDKVSIREVKLGKLDNIFRLFCSVIPRQWNPASGPVVLASFDAFDALIIGSQAANPTIVRAALEKLPYTKAILQSGKTTDFMNNEPLVVDGKFRVDQFIELACDSMTTRINTGRVLKTLSPVNALVTIASIEKAWQFATGSEYSSILTRISKSCAGRMQNMFNESVPANPCSVGSEKKDKAANNTDTQKTGDTTANAESVWLSNADVFVTAGVSMIAAFLSHRLQHIYVDGYIKVLDLLVSSDRVTFDHATTYAKINTLKNKLQWFGFSNSRVERMQAILNKI